MKKTTFYEFWFLLIENNINSQTCPNGRLWITPVNNGQSAALTASLKPNFHSYFSYNPLHNGHFFRSRGWPLYTGLNIQSNLCYQPPLNNSHQSTTASLIPCILSTNLCIMANFWTRENFFWVQRVAVVHRFDCI